MSRCSPVQQGLPRSNADTVRSDERHCGPRTWSDVWTWSLAWPVLLHFPESLQRAEQNQAHYQFWLGLGFKLNHLCSTNLLLISSIDGLLREEAAESQVS